MTAAGAAAGRNRAVDLFTLVAIGSGALLVCREANVEPRLWVIGFVLFAIYLARYAALGFHELGHLVAASIAGWRWDVFKLGPLLLSRESGVFRVSLRAGRRFKAAGLVLTRPVSPQSNTKIRHILMLSGGPLASALLSLCAAAVWDATPSPLPRIACGITAIFSGIVCVTTLFPFTSSGNPSDGRTILNLLRERAERNPWDARQFGS